MTIENIELRDMLKRVEGVAVNALSTQPHDDDKCKSHLEAAVKKIKSILGIEHGGCHDI